MSHHHIMNIIWNKNQWEVATQPKMKYIPHEIHSSFFLRTSSDKKKLKREKKLAVSTQCMLTYHND